MTSATIPGVSGSRTATRNEAGVTVLLTQLSKAVYRRTSEAALGMRLREFVTLAHLRNHSGITQHELGEAICVDANNLVILLNELEASASPCAGVTPRTAGGTWSRSRRPAGWPSSTREDAIALVEDEALGALSASERASLQRLLAKAIDSNLA